MAPPLLVSQSFNFVGDRLRFAAIDGDFFQDLDPLAQILDFAARLGIAGGRAIGVIMPAAPPFAARSLVAHELPAAPRSWIASTSSSR